MSEARPSGRQKGRRVADRYQLLEPIGRGGMGIVWRAHDELLDRAVAVKEVRYPGDPQDDEVAELNRRTLREARAAGRLTHPNVVVVHDVIEENGRPWIVMQLVDARSLGQVLRDDGPLPVRMVAEIGLQILEALRTAHAAGVLHRDVKPENVLLTDDGRVVLTDFGIARMETDTTMTRTGLVGTPAFIAPERLKGLSAQRESDLWSLGATLYAAVEGRPPHDKGMAMATMHAVLNDQPEPAVRAGRLGAVLSGLLEKNPAERLSVDQAERMLRSIAEDRSSAPATSQRTMPATPLPAPATSPPRKPAKNPKPSRQSAPPEQGAEERRQAAAAGTPAAAAVPPAPADAPNRAEALEQVQSLKQAPASKQAKRPEAAEEPAAAGPSPRPGGPAGRAPAEPVEPAEREQAGPEPVGQDRAGDAAGSVDGERAGASKQEGEPQDGAPPEDQGNGKAAAPGAPVQPVTRAGAPVQPITPVRPVPPDGSAAPDMPDGEAVAQRPTQVPRPARVAKVETRPDTRRRPYAGPDAPQTSDQLSSADPALVSTASAMAAGPEMTSDGHAPTSVEHSVPMSPDGYGDGTPPERPLPLRRILLFAVPVVLVVAGVALWLGLRDATGTPTDGAAKSSRQASEPATAPSSSAPSSAPPSPSASPSETPKPSSTPKPTKSSPAGVPDGWHRYKHPSGFSIALPKGWRVDGRGNGEVRFRGDAHSYLEVHHTSRPESDALKVWRRDVPGMSGNFPGYKLIAIRKVKGYWKTAADWEFTFGDSGFRSRVIDRGFVTGKNHGYALLFKTQDKDWKNKKKLFETFAETFKPAK
ncbi:hypothetical protein GCM10022226_29250 [Sphaerisporangium flaviroseum]|uniref:non-specific serine/threonine protein kinase n=1 Tax=Sphaerisporangium flaviroseum TaxID=509199 RepID=A0ABP7I2M7_9ACTN